MRKCQSAILLLLYCLSYACYAQDEPEKGGILNLASRLLGGIQHRTATMGEQLTDQTEKYLHSMERREQRLYKKLYKVDSSAARSLFSGTHSRDFARVLAHEFGHAAFEVRHGSIALFRPGPKDARGHDDGNPNGQAADAAEKQYDKNYRKALEMLKKAVEGSLKSY